MVNCSKCTPRKRDQFLEELAKTGNVTVAAAAVVLVLGAVVRMRESGTERQTSEGDIRSGQRVAAHVGAYEDSVRNVMAGTGQAIDAPLDREIANLKRDLANTAEFLLGCLQLDGQVSADG